ncbi:alpha/beta hydrolase family protein [Streptomyces roseicoloratus]|uniref:Alpha/beta hydrolase n=1 Tax=Streptomyces roseicoloratus TaxID=2508722 RepID=A0ABY9RPT6_9ACTN|nr:alpha/beta hydrolase [Streptomyces roseicoloratus]WMX43778.1 alpha/beta hydrolase [Streptomyces roseicoloratus]
MITPIRAAATALLACAVALPATALPATAATPTAVAAAPAPAPAPLAGTAPAADPLELPAPTGGFRVGASVLHLVDRSRPDPWVPTADGRELMVTLHYPAARKAHGRPAPYATEDEARLLLRGVGTADPASVRALAGMGTYSVRDARPAPGRHPLVVLSPGFGVPRFTLTATAVELASRGYAVASVDHAYETSGTSVPGGRVLTCVACAALEEGRVKGSDVTAARAADVRFLLDRITGPHAAWPYARSIDRSRIGMAGHSIGGASAATAMLADRRIDAGVNMDGSFWDTLPAGGLGGRPFLFLGTDDAVHRPGGEDETWDRTWQALDGWKRWLTVAGADHFTFSDGPVIQRHFGLPAGPIPADRALAVTRAYVAAFFDEHLKGVPQPLLTGPSAQHPEVRFHRP